MDKENNKTNALPLNQEITETYLKEKARREKEYNTKQKFKAKPRHDEEDYSYKIRKTKRK